MAQPVIVSRGGTAVTRFFKKLVAAVFYLAAVLLSGVGLTTLIYAPLRDMFIGLIQSLISGL